MSLVRPIAFATAVAGTIDIAAAMLVTLSYGRPVDAMLRYVASGPFPPATGWGASGALLGLIVHYALIAVMAAVYLMAAKQVPALRRSPLRWGAAYGVVTYVVMNLIVVPLRFGTGFPPSLIGFVTQLSFHVILVGIPIAIIAARHLNPAPVRA
jgi:hypothetical protein